MLGVELTHHGGETMNRPYEEWLATTGAIFDELFDYRRRALMLGHEPG